MLSLWVVDASVVKTGISTMTTSLENTKGHEKLAEDVYNSLSNYLDRVTVDSIKTCLDSILHSIEVIQNNIDYARSIEVNISLYNADALNSRIKQSLDEEVNARAQLQAIQDYALNIRISIFAKLKNFLNGVWINLKLLAFNIKTLCLQSLKKIWDFVKFIYDWFQQATVRYFIYTGIGFATFTIILILFFNYMRRFETPLWIIP